LQNNRDQIKGENHGEKEIRVNCPHPHPSISPLRTVIRLGGEARREWAGESESGVLKASHVQFSVSEFQNYLFWSGLNHEGGGLDDTND
jgi:hypothetical protein